MFQAGDKVKLVGSSRGLTADKIYTIKRHPRIGCLFVQYDEDPDNGVRIDRVPDGHFQLVEKAPVRPSYKDWKYG